MKEISHMSMFCEQGGAETWLLVRVENQFLRENFGGFGDFEEGGVDFVSEFAG